MTYPRTLLACILPLCLIGAAHGQITKLPHDPAPDDFFGSAVAISGDHAAVGASGEDECGPHSGAAYVFSRSPDTGVWSEPQRIVCTECRRNQFFGQEMAMDGDVLVVAGGTEYFGQEQPNTAHVFERDADGVWRERAHLQPDVALRGTFATSVDVDDGRILVVASGDRRTNAAGVAFIYEVNDEGEWQQQAVIRPVPPARPQSDVFGGRGAIDGDRVIISAPGRSATRGGAIYLFERHPATGHWQQRARVDGFSNANLAVALEGDLALVGDSEGGRIGGGRARLLARDDSGGWTIAQQLVPSASSHSGAFGTAVSLMDGRALVVGFDEQLDQAVNIDRVVFVFEPDEREGEWRQRHIIDIGETEFGAALDADGGYAIVGSSGDTRRGAAYVIRIH